MAVVTENTEILCLNSDCSSPKKMKEPGGTPEPPIGALANESAVLKSGGNENVDGEIGERKKKTRRGKPKRKNPYNKDGNENRKVANLSKNRPRFAHRHADAPYNTNEFLMEDHSAFVNALVEPPTVSMQPNVDKPRPPRVRDPSFTSVESDEDHFYSSPEDEEEYLTKEFSNTYQELHIETLQGMSKHELIQQVLQLEEKLDGLEKNLGNSYINRPTDIKSEKQQSEILTNTTEYLVEDGDRLSLDRMKQFQMEIGRLRLENEKLQIENERLQRRNRSSSVSSVDSESDSTSSSPSSVGSLSDKEELIESNLMEETDDPREKYVVSDEPFHVDDAMNDKSL